MSWGEESCKNFGSCEIATMEICNTKCIKYFNIKEVPKDSIEGKLFNLIDNIDTATDAFKPELNPFVKYVLKQIAKAHELIESDGYKLYYKE